MLELFRREAVQHATRRLAGEVVLAAPLSVKTLGLVLAGILFAAVAFATQASYARKATVTGLLVPDQGMIRATVQASGMLETLMVREGDGVTRGQRIAVIGLAAVTSDGNVGDVVVRSPRVGAKRRPGSRAGRTRPAQGRGRAVAHSPWQGTVRARADRSNARAPGATASPGPR